MDGQSCRGNLTPTAVILLVRYWLADMCALIFVVAETKEECRELELVLLAAVGGTSSN